MEAGNEIFTIAIAVLIFLTVMMWIFLPWLVMRIESNTVKARKAIERIELSINQALAMKDETPTAHAEFGDGSEIDIELTERDMWK